MTGGVGRRLPFLIVMGLVALALILGVAVSKAVAQTSNSSKKSSASTAPAKRSTTSTATTATRTSVPAPASRKPTTPASAAADTARKAAEPVAEDSARKAPQPSAPAAAAPAPSGGSSVRNWFVWLFAPAGAVLALVFARRFYKEMLTAPDGNDRMREIAGHVRVGAMAYIRQQYKVVAMFFVVAVIALGLLAFVAKVQHALVPFAFLTGGFFSGLSGFLGLKTATNASSRTAQGAMESLDRGLRVAFRSGAVMGLVVVGLGLLDIALWFFALRLFGMGLQETTVVMLCFGMGASTQALFARVGGGIYTKAADVGADLVGKVEAGIPEDDPRNPAVIADNVGDNVGDVAGMGADLYESYCGAILAAAALGVAAGLGMAGVVLPMAVAGVGIGASILGVYVVRTREGASQRELLHALGKGVWASSGVILLGSLLLCLILLVGRNFDGAPGFHWWGPFLSIIAGLASGIVIGKATEYNTAADFSPTQGIAHQAATGPATVIIEGLAVGMKSTWIPVLSVGVGTLLAYFFCGGAQNSALGLFGVGIAAVGMLSTLGITLATDAYGPIADNAGGNAEMSHLGPEVRGRTDALDSLGNTTAATGKGFAIGSAALTALALLAAYIEEVRVGIVRFVSAHTLTDAQKDLYGVRAALDGTGAEMFVDGNWVSVAKAQLADFAYKYDITLMNPKVIVGLFIGGMLVMLFCAMTMKAVGRAAGAMVKEVRRQFREIPGIMEGTATPDYAACVRISTAGAQREMVVPSVMALVVPVLMGALLGVEGVMGLLAGALVCGFVVAVMMANAGGAWDNAKKYIEGAGLRERMMAPKDLVEARRQAEGAEFAEDGALIVRDKGGDPLVAAARPALEVADTPDLAPVIVARAKGSAYHKAAVVGDTVGDPFKDTSGPSLNILIKLMSMVSVVFAGFTVKYAPLVWNALTGWFK